MPVSSSKSHNSVDKPPEISGQVIFVVGGSGGIGTAIVKDLADRGAKVVLGYHSSENIATEVLSQLSGNHMAMAIDVTDITSIENAEREISNRFGATDSIIYCAGIHKAGPLISLSTADVARQISVNLTGAIEVSRIFLKSMVRRRTGNLVFLGSVSASRVTRGHAVYSASKAALEGLTRALAVEVAGRGIRVNCLVPGPVLTPMLEETIRTTGDNPAQRVPMGRLIEAEEVAAAAAHLISPCSRSQTGTSLVIDGGYLLL